MADGAGCFLTLSLLLITLSLTFPATGKPFESEKLSHFRFYWHDVQSGTNPTSITIAKPNSNLSTNPTGFGFMNMIDDPLTEEPEIGSRMVGRAQGFYGMCSKEEMSLLMSMSFAFVVGRYNGSTLIVSGRNPVNEKVREMPVVGGSGVFRFARGYVQARTYSFNAKTGDAIVKYDVYVLH